MIYILISIGTLVCAVQAIRSERLIVSSIWLAGTSALLSLAMFLLGATEVAVIELSVGAGLVTVLFVFAINIAGDEKISRKTTIAKPLSALMITISAVLLMVLVLPNEVPALNSVLPADFQTILWENRTLDMLIQIVIIFSGVLGVIGLLGTQHENGKVDHS